jgi:hypothetical protein
MSSLAPHVRDKLKARLVAATLKADLAVEADEEAEAALVARRAVASKESSGDMDLRLGMPTVMGALPWQATSQLSLESGAVTTGNVIVTDGTAADCDVARTPLNLSQPVAAVLDKVRVCFYPFTHYRHSTHHFSRILPSFPQTLKLLQHSPFKHQSLPQESFAPTASSSRMAATGVNLAAAQVGFTKVHCVL